MTKVTNRPNHVILYCIYFENKYVNVLEMDTHIFICYENERIEFMKIELSKIWVMYTFFNFSANLQSCGCRLAIFVNKQNNKT